MLILHKRQFVFLSYLMLFILSNEIWGLILIPERLETILAYLLPIGMTLRLFVGKSFRLNSVESTMIFMLLVLGCISFIPAFLVHNQPFYYSAMASKNVFYLTIFFLLRVDKVSWRDVNFFFLFIGLIWCLIMLIQYFSFPMFLFSSSKVKALALDDIEIRSGIARLSPAGKDFGVFFTYYNFVEFLNKARLKNLLLMILGIAAIYLYATRQVLAASFLPLFLYWLWLLKKKNFGIRAFHVFIVLCFVIGIGIHFNDLFGGFIDLTKSKNEGDMIRALSIHFYLFDYWDGPLTWLFGNGVAHYATSYGQEIKAIYGKGLFHSDIGIIGTINLYGFFFGVTVLSGLVFCLQKAFNKKYAVAALYIISVLLQYALYDPFANYRSVAALTGVLFLLSQVPEKKESCVEDSCYV